MGALWGHWHRQALRPVEPPALLMFKIVWRNPFRVPPPPSPLPDQCGLLHPLASPGPSLFVLGRHLGTFGVTSLHAGARIRLQLRLGRAHMTQLASYVTGTTSIAPRKLAMHASLSRLCLPMLLWAGTRKACPTPRCSRCPQGVKLATATPRPRPCMCTCIRAPSRGEGVVATKCRCSPPYLAAGNHICFCVCVHHWLCAPWAAAPWVSPVCPWPASPGSLRTRGTR